MLGIPSTVTKTIYCLLVSKERLGNGKYECGKAKSQSAQCHDRESWPLIEFGTRTVCCLLVESLVVRKSNSMVRSMHSNF